MKKLKLYKKFEEKNHFDYILFFVESIQSFDIQAV
jgi:hypothetical protein